MTYQLWADGACQPNPGIGGWSYYIQIEDDKNDNGYGHVFDYGCVPQSTNNRMELTGLYQGLLYFHKISKEDDQLIIELDSKYVLDGMKNWSLNWVKQGWKKKNGKPVLNDDLWKRIRSLLDEIGPRVEYKHIHGHTGHKQNGLCDKLAVRSILEYKGILEECKEVDDVGSLG